MSPNWSERDLKNINELKEFYAKSFNRSQLSLDEERTLEFYYKLGETRGVDGKLYVTEAVQRAAIKGTVKKPISYVASLCKTFYRRGLYHQSSREEDDLFHYIENKIGDLSDDNRKLLVTAVSRNGTTRVMAAAAELLNRSDLQDQIIEAIILKVVEIFGPPPQAS